MRNTEKLIGGNRRLTVSMWMTVFVLFVALILLSVNVSANGAMPPPTKPPHQFLTIVLLLFIINLPINTFTYMLILFLLYIFHKKEPGLFRDSTKLFMGTIFLVSFLATIMGGFIDTFFFYEFGYMFMRPSQTAEGTVMALTLIFFSFFLLSYFLQRLKLMDSLIVGFGMVIYNLLFWSAIFYGMMGGEAMLYLIIYIPIVLAIMTILFAVWYWLRHKTIFSPQKGIPKVDKTIFATGWLCGVFIIVIILFMLISIPAYYSNSDQYIVAFAARCTAQNQSDNTAYWVIVSVSPNRGDDWNNVKWQLVDTNGNSTNLDTAINEQKKPDYLSTVQYGIVYNEIDGNGNLNAGDRLKVKAPSSGEYKLRAIHHGSVIFESAFVYF